MKRTPLKRKTPLKARRRPQNALGRPLLRQIGKDAVPQAKKRIQALLREKAIQRDGGCVLRHYPEAGPCGGYRKDGGLILQAEHLVTRVNSISYGDMRNIVCLCRHHHGRFKPQHGRLYWELVERHVGPERWAWIRRVEEEHRNHKTHRMTLWDWQKVDLALRADL